MQGAGQGSRLGHQRGKYAGKIGRLVLAVWQRRAVTASPRLYGISLLVSDDHGETWRHTGDAGIGYGMGEGRIVELQDGRILLNARGGKAVRNGKKVETQKHRVYAYRDDAGETVGAREVRTDCTYTTTACDWCLPRYATTVWHERIIP